MYFTITIRFNLKKIILRQCCIYFNLKPTSYGFNFCLNFKSHCICFTENNKRITFDLIDTSVVLTGCYIKKNVIDVIFVAIKIDRYSFYFFTSPDSLQSSVDCA